MWLFTNLSLNGQISEPKYNKKGFSVYGDVLWEFEPNTKTYWFYYGYLLFRNGMEPEGNNIKDKINYAIINGHDLKNIIKGNFVFIKFTERSFEIIGDRFGIQKWFIWQNNKDSFIISDRLSTIRDIVKPDIYQEAMALYSLTYHWTSELTIFKSILHNGPSHYVCYNNGLFEISKYWNPIQLLNCNREDITIKDLVNVLSEHIAQLLNIYNGKISLSLTGGADTRNILALLLKNGITPHLYTYGNPKSNDCVKASNIAKGLKLQHSIHNIQMNSNIFRNYSQKIIKWGQSLTSIHRTHRIMAVERESEYADIMFLGTLGGEFVKGVSEDDYIVPSIVTQNWNTLELENGIIQIWLDKKKINESAINKENLENYLNSEPYFQGNIIQKKMASLTHITTHLHDAQDIILYQYPMKYVFTPFLDIDYLEILFASSFSFNNKEIIPNKIIRRVTNPIFCSNFIKEAYPPLGSYRYSGEHKPNEVLFNPYYAAFIKLFRQKIHNPYLPNFPLDNWMLEFVKEELPKCFHYEPIKNTFNVDLLINLLNSNKLISKESFWLKFTNPIIMRFILDYV